MAASTLWSLEKDWLVEVVMLPKDEPEDEHAETVEWIGRLQAFAAVTNTRMVAQVGDPDVPVYELWFSFDGAENKKSFLYLVQEDGYANPNEPHSFDAPPNLKDVPNLRPLAEVFPREDTLRMIAVAAMTSELLESDEGNEKPN